MNNTFKALLVNTIFLFYVPALAAPKPVEVCQAFWDEYHHDVTARLGRPPDGPERSDCDKLNQDTATTTPVGGADPVQSPIRKYSVQMNLKDHKIVCEVDVAEKQYSRFARPSTAPEKLPQ